MDNNFGKIALGCALARENKYTDLQIAGAAGIDENQVAWLVRAGRDGTLRNVLAACNSVQSFCAFMAADPDVRRQSVKTAIATGEPLNQKAIEVARRVVLNRFPRKAKAISVGANRGAV